MLKSWIEAIRRGNEYRLAKYGPADTFAESYRRARSHVEWERANIKTKTEHSYPWDRDYVDKCKDIDLFKNKFAYWDEWTGSRYERVTNPNPIRVVDNYSVCRSNPVTGQWYEL